MWRPGWVLPNPVRATHFVGGMITDTKQLMKAAGLEREDKRLRALQARSMAAYEAGRLAEGDKLAVKADVLGEKIDTVLMALEEEYEGAQEPPIQSITRAMAEAWNECMHPAWPSECRKQVEEYRRTGHGEWQAPQTAFVGPTNMWGKSSPAEHPEWHEHREGYYMDPGLVHQLREIVGNPEANGLLLLDAAEDAWYATYATAARIRAGAARRRSSGIDPVKEAKKFIRRSTRRRKRTSRNSRRHYSRRAG
jgi:hypothetical protein